jgi:small subunit ribosomal protein S11
LTDVDGNTLYWISAGKLGFKGKRKATPFASSKVITLLCQVAKKIGINQADAFVNGIGSGRKSALKTLGAQEVDLLSLKDVTPMPHNGCMPRKPKRK